MGSAVSLATLRRAADADEEAFNAACKTAGFMDKWHAYRNEATWPPELVAAHKRWMTSLHTFYGKRDGPKGVLGGRGL